MLLYSLFRLTVKVEVEQCALSTGMDSRLRHCQWKKGSAAFIVSAGRPVAFLLSGEETSGTSVYFSDTQTKQDPCIL